jgi:phosphopantetheine adenylyltransferase
MDVQITTIKSLKDFQREIEQLAFEKRIDFMEAVILYCEQTGMEIESAGSLIKTSAKMKARIQDEAEALNYFPKTTKLPI